MLISKCKSVGQPVKRDILEKKKNRYKLNKILHRSITSMHSMSTETYFATTQFSNEDSYMFVYRVD